MGKAIVGIGIPGSGKTTLLKSFAEKNGYYYICPDDIRAELTGDAANQTKNREVWGQVYERALKAVRSDVTIVIDATFANRKDRVSFVNFLRESGVEKIQGVYVDTPC